MLEISVIRENQLVWEFNREQRRALERAAGKILKDAALTFIVCFFIAGLLTIGGTMIQNIFFPIAIPCVDTSKIDRLGRDILTVTRRIGYFTCLIMCTKDIISSVTTGSYKDIVGIVVKYSAAYAGFYALPSIFDMIQATFA